MAKSKGHNSERPKKHPRSKRTAAQRKRRLKEKGFASSFTPRKKEESLGISNAPTEQLIVPKVEPSTSDFQSSLDPLPSESKFEVSNAFFIEGRRIVDINFFLIELQKLNRHSKSGCSLNDIIIISEDKTGLLSCFHCKCKVCEFQKVFWTEDPENGGTNINSDAVAGLVGIGCGFRNMREIFLKMNIPTLTGTLFSKEYDKLSHQMEAAIDEEEIGTTEDEAIMIVEYDDDGLGTDEEMVNGEQEDESVVGLQNGSGGIVSDAIIAIVEEMEAHVDEIMNEEQEAESVVGYPDGSEEILPICDRINTAGEKEESSSHGIAPDELGTERPKDGSIHIVAEQETVVSKETIADDDDNKIIPGEMIDNQEMKQLVDEAIVVANAILIEDVKSLNTATDESSMNNTSCETYNLLRQICQDSGNSDASNTLMGTPEQSGKQPYFRCEDCSTDFQKDDSLRVHRMYHCCNRIMIPPVSTPRVERATMADASLPLIDLPQSWASKTVLSRLSALKLAMADNKSALGEAMKIASELRNLINLKKSAKKHKERGLKALEEAMDREKSITSSNRPNERPVVSDMKTRAASEVESALALEKYVDDTLEPTVLKQGDVLEATVEANSREQLALVELAKVIEDGKESAISTSEKCQTDKTLISEKSTGMAYKRKLDAVSKPASNEQRGKDEVCYQ